MNEGITTIDTYAIYNVDWLTSITIPSTVTSIGANAIQGCDVLSTITCLPTTPPSITNSTLPSISTGVLQHIYVPAASESAYESAQYWNTYAAFIDPIS